MNQSPLDPKLKAAVVAELRRIQTAFASNPSPVPELDAMFKTIFDLRIQELEEGTNR